jgi:hypothetical protein
LSDGIFKIDGIPKLDTALSRIGGDLKEQMIRKALHDGGTIMQAAIIANAPINPKMPGPKSTALPPGALQSDVHLTVSKDKGSENSFSAWIYFGAATVHVARFVEWGHLLVRGGRTGKGIITKLKSGADDVAAHPFIRPALDGNIDLVAAAMADSIKASLNLRGNVSGIEIEQHEYAGGEE